jgi:hypothetical protein
MIEHIVESFIDLHKVLEIFGTDSNWCYRGHACSDWSLVPKVGRKPFDKINDRALFNQWKSRGYQYFEREYKNDLDYLTLGQHHGLTTRLLDWTENPLVASYFAVCDYEQNDGIVFAVRINDVIFSKEDPWKYKGIASFIPKGIGARVVRQWGCFTLHSPPTLSISQDNMNKEDLHRIIIKHSCKKKLRFDLYHYGIGAEMLFPGLDGWSQDINWQYENNDEWINLRNL